MLLTIISTLIVIFVIGFLITKVAKRVIEERKKKRYANMPRNVLRSYALMDPAYLLQYKNFCMVMSEEKATEIVTNRMLIDMGLIGYRKAGT